MRFPSLDRRQRKLSGQGASLRALGPLYENRERQLRRITGVEATVDPLPHLAAKQRIVMETAESMPRAAGIAPEIGAQACVKV